MKAVKNNETKNKIAHKTLDKRGYWYVERRMGGWAIKIKLFTALGISKCFAESAEHFEIASGILMNEMIGYCITTSQLQYHHPPSALLISIFLL